MELSAQLEATFLERKNRFLAVVELEGERVEAHLHDPGRLEELLWEGNRLLLRRASNPRRKTRFDILAAGSEGGWVLVHSGTHRALAQALLLHPRCSPIPGVVSLRAEVAVGRSRIDFMARLSKGQSVAVETKGCTLCRRGRALFPDAPTQRGRRHLEELARLAGRGEGAAVVVLVTCPGARCFAPNGHTDPAFALAFSQALAKGVEVHPVSISYDGRWLHYQGRLPLCPRPWPGADEEAGRGRGAV